MKKLFGNTLSNLSNTASAVSRQLDKTLGDKPASPAPAEKRPSSPEKQYLRCAEISRQIKQDPCSIMQSSKPMEQ
jgi:hypothetical protein